MSANAEPWLPNEAVRRLSGTRFTDVRYLDRTESTNADLLAAARAGRIEPTVLVAGHQTAGRGRHERSWFDEPGSSLLVSALVPASSRWAGLVPLATGLAAVDAIEALADSPSGGGSTGVVALKWPNDLLVPGLDERKLAGILVEATTGSSGEDLAVVIGMGLNLRWSSTPPDEVGARAATLAMVYEQVLGIAAGPELRDAILVEYLLALDHRLSELAGPEGRRSILDAYRRRCSTIGRDVTLSTPSGTVAGRAVDVGSDGELLIEEPGGDVRPVTSGDAHHRDNADRPG